MSGVFSRMASERSMNAFSMFTFVLAEVWKRNNNAGAPNSNEGIEPPICLTTVALSWGSRDQKD